MAGRAPGRGAYLCTQRECWERALGRADILGRALKVTVTADNRAALLAAAPAAAHEADDDSNPPEGDDPGGDKGE